MTHTKSNTLLVLVESFFRDYLKNACGASHHTVRAYRDSLRLFFCFLADYKNGDVASLRLEDLHVEAVTAFLTHLEVKRSNTVASRNYRLAAIRCFFKHLIRHDLQRADQYYRVLAMPLKRTHVPLATYLEPEDVRLLIKQPDRSTSSGARDYALLLFLYNTGARISEALSICANDLSMIKPQQVRLHGKGNKDRLCPLWRDTVKALLLLPNAQKGKHLDPLFCNRNGVALSRDGAAYILRKYVTLAAKEAPELKKLKITAHVMRHSCAVALLQAGVDITVIRDYLGHASIATTNRYIMTNLQMKRDALEKFWDQSGLSPSDSKPWKPTPDLLKFLTSL